MVICVPGGKKGLLAALDLKSGKVLWQSKTITDQAPYAAPVLAKIHDTLTIVVVTNQGIYGVLPKSGEELFRYTRNEPYDDVVISTPIVGNNRVFTSVGFGQGCDFIELVRTAGNPRISTIMSNKLVQNRDGSMVLVDNHLYGHSENQGWFCLDFTTGKLKWNDRTALERGSVAYADGKLYCLGEKGNVVLAEATPEGWSETSRFRLPKASSKRLPSGAVWTNPVIADGKLYLRDQEFLYCYAIK
ncbi:MAG: PQQ-binding-like beta-propeller repeat protein [Zavarzinella sp.]